MGLWANLSTSLENALVTVPGLVASPLPFDVSHLPETLMGRAFCIDIQSQNTDAARDRATMLVEHAVTVRVVYTIAPLGGWAKTLRRALDDELDILDAFMSQTNFPTYRVKYAGSDRALSDTREHMVVGLSFSFLHAISVTS